ncbi:DinB family protein [Aquiflexum sp.]|uniref:DinB family protein n=1 Tax=Aquiflexum sp. TaxID=1872584 RepID=UPI00359431C9
MKAHFQDLYEYSLQSNLTTIGLLETYGSEVPEKIIRNFSHILNAQHLWNHRIEGSKSSFKVWDIHPISQLREINESLFQQSFTIIEKEDFERQVDYINSQKESYTNSVKEIIFHVVNHSTYHRGQVMIQLRESGLEATSTDYIFYKRK